MGQRADSDHEPLQGSVPRHQCPQASTGGSRTLMSDDRPERDCGLPGGCSAISELTSCSHGRLASQPTREQGAQQGQSPGLPRSCLPHSTVQNLASQVSHCSWHRASELPLGFLEVGSFKPAQLGSPIVHAPFPLSCPHFCACTPRQRLDLRSDRQLPCWKSGWP